MAATLDLGKCLVPVPRSFEMTGPSFDGRRGLTVILPPDADDADRFAAGRIWETLQAANAPVRLEQRWDLLPPTPAVVMARTGRDRAFLERASIEPVELPTQGYHLHVEAGRVVLLGADATGLFYGAVTLAQLLRSRLDLPGCRITDYPDLPVRGITHDVSRGKVPTLETLYGLVDDLASWKVNMLQLYTEHTFTFRKHPKIGAGCGALTPEDMIRLDAYCRQRHVMLVPNLSTFGHMEPILSLPEYRALAEDESRPWCLNPTDERSYALLDDLLSELLPNFSAPFFNANCDETYGLGEGKSKPLADEIGVGRVYLRHIHRLHELVTGKYGRRMMIWGDIILHHPELIPELPEDVIVLDWHYEAERDWTLSRKFADAGRTFYVCPGTSSWNALFPRLATSRANIRGFGAAGTEYGAAGMLNTDWGDGGHPNLLGHSLYGFAYGAQIGWCAAADDNAFDAAFGQMTFGDRGSDVVRAMRLLDEADTRVGIKLGNRSVTWRFMVEEPFAGPYLAQADLAKVSRALECVEEAQGLLRGLRGRKTPRPDVIDEIDFAAQQLSHALRKARWVVQTRASWSEPDEAWLRRQAAELRELRGEVGGLAKTFAALWRRRAVEPGLKANLERYDGLAKAYRAAETLLKNAQRALGQGKPLPELPLPPA